MMAYKFSGNFKCMLFVLALHVDTVLMANFQISYGRMGQGKLSVGAEKCITEPDALRAQITPPECLP